jgi:hypothetical protein
MLENKNFKKYKLGSSSILITKKLKFNLKYMNENKEEFKKIEKDLFKVIEDEKKPLCYFNGEGKDILDISNNVLNKNEYYNMYRDLKIYFFKEQIYVMKSINIPLSTLIKENIIIVLLNKNSRKVLCNLSFEDLLNGKLDDIIIEFKKDNKLEDIFCFAFTPNKKKIRIQEVKKFMIKHNITEDMVIEYDKEKENYNINLVRLIAYFLDDYGIYVQNIQIIKKTKDDYGNLLIVT